MSKVVINEVTIGNDEQFENRMTQCTIDNRKHMVNATRYIASFTNVGGDVHSHDFKDWLESLGLNDDDVYTIKYLATNGKDELQKSAREFLQK